MSGAIEARTYRETEAAVFFRARERFGELGNMAGGFPLEIAGTPIGSSEAYYQAIRWSHRPDVQQRILDEKSPMTAKRTAYLFLDDSRPDWDQIKIRVMRFALRAKLLFHDEAIRAVLRKTEARPIVERSQRDDFWGALPHGDGPCAVATCSAASGWSCARRSRPNLNSTRMGSAIPAFPITAFSAAISMASRRLPGRRR